MQATKKLIEAYEIDRQLGTEFWIKAIEKQMENTRISFDKLDGVTTDEVRKRKFRPVYENEMVT